MFQDFEYRTAIDFCLFLGVSLKEYNKEPDIYVYIFALYITALLVLAIGVPCLNINNDFFKMGSMYASLWDIPWCCFLF